MEHRRPRRCSFSFFGLITTFRKQKKAEAPSLGYKYTQKKGEKTEQVELMSQKRTRGRVAGEGTGDRDQDQGEEMRQPIFFYCHNQ
jgi:hypothetical protein